MTEVVPAPVTPLVAAVGDELEAGRRAVTASPSRARHRARTGGGPADPVRTRPRASVTSPTPSTTAARAGCRPPRARDSHDQGLPGGPHRIRPATANATGEGPGSVNTTRIHSVIRGGRIPGWATARRAASTAGREHDRLCLRSVHMCF